MKKITFLFLMAFLPLVVNAEKVEIDGIWYNLDNDSQTAEVTSNPAKYSGEVDVPDIVTYVFKDYTVTSIGEKAFYDCSELTSVSLPISIEKIGDWAFAGCLNMGNIGEPYISSTSTTIELAKLKEIGNFAFKDCSNLYNMHIGRSVSLIGEGAFAGCDRLNDFWVSGYNSNFSTIDGILYNKDKTILVCCPATKGGVIDISQAITKIEPYAFYHCRAFLDFKYNAFPYLKEIGREAFVGCSLLSSIYIDTQVETIGSACFVGCSSLESFTVYDNSIFSEIDGVLFENQTTIKAYPNKKGDEYVIKEGVTSIADHAFSKTDIKIITFPSTLSYISECAFSDCDKLVSITSLIANPKAISNEAFSEYTYNNTKLIIPTGTIDLYKNSEGWKNFKIIVEDNNSQNNDDEEESDTFITTIAHFKYSCNKKTKESTLIGNDNSEFTEVRIPTSITIDEDKYTVVGIGDEAFMNTGIKFLELPSTITSIGERAFWDNSMTTIFSHIEDPFSINNNVFAPIEDAVLYVPVGSISKYKETAGWNEFGKMMEGNEANIESIKYVYNTSTKTAVVICGDYSELTEARIPASIIVDGNTYSVNGIGEHAFKNCSITTLELPSTLTSIGERAFWNNQLSKVISYIEEPFTISNTVFTSPEATLYVPANTKAAYQTTDGWDVFGNIVEMENPEQDGLKDGDTFEATVSGTTFRFMVLSAADKTCQVGVNTPLSERRNDYWGDAITTSITKFVTVPGKVTATDNNEYTVVKIGENAFVSYDQMEYVNLPSSIKEIGFQSFYYCRGLKIIAMQEGLTQISGYAFGACYNLSLVEIPSTVTSIGAFAFWDCRRLTDVISKIETPFALNGYEFNNTMSKLNLTVPAGKASIYKETDGWKEFAKIEEMSSDVTDGLKSGDIFEATVDGITFKFRVLDPYAKTCQIGADQKCDAKVSGSGWDGTLPSVVTGSDGIEYTVTGIGNRAFWDYGTGLKTVTLPSTLEWIDEGAFMRCKGLQSIVIPEGVKSIENYAFNGCSALETVELPSTLTGIANNAFGGCPITKVVAKMEELFPIGDETFPSDVTIVVPKGLLDTYKDAYGWKNYENIVEDEGDETVVEQDGFVLTPNEEEKSVTVDSYDETAKEVEIMPTVEIEGEQYDVTAIGEGAFENNETMEKVTIPEGVVSIGNNAFKGCVSLKEIFCYATEPATLGNSKVKARTRGDGVEAEVEVASVFEGVNTETCILYVPEGCADKYREADGWKEFKNIVEMKGTEVPESEPITISGALQVPYYSEYNLDFTDKPELKAYVATGYDKSTGVIWLTRVKQVPAETGFLLMGDPGDYDIPTIEGVSDVYYKNMFKGTLTGTTLYTTDGDYTNYYLSKGDAGVGFYKVTKEDGVKVGANRCYLPILTEIPVNGSEGDTELIKVSAAKQVPYYTSKNLDFSSLDAQGVKAYTATGYNYGTGVIWLTRVKKVPAQTGILVMADVEGDYNVPTASVQSVYENMFVGSETAQTIYTNEEIGGVDYVNYYLSKGDAGVGFYKVTNPDGVKMGANRCYLPIPKRDSASGARGKNRETETFCQMVLSDESNDDVIAIPVFGGMNGEDDGTTGIDIQSSIFNLQSNEVYYNLQGQRVENPRKGIYIKNGKMVVIK